MGRPSKKSFINIADAMKRIDEWRAGKNCKFSTGDVVERNGKDIRSSAISTRRCRNISS
jgi:hypothetical protein